MKKYFLPLFLLIVGQMNAQWSTNPNINNPITTGVNEEYNPLSVSDNMGGAIIAWIEQRNGKESVYAQRISSLGVILWPSTGVLIDTSNIIQYLDIVSDGANGAIITWNSRRNTNSDIFAQKINSSGITQWTAGGVTICNKTGDKFNPYICSDNVGGAIIAWQETTIIPNRFNNSAQRINAFGNIQWPINGVVINNNGAAYDVPKICTDGQNGAIITWTDTRTASPQIYSQRINSLGFAQWPTNGVAISNTTGSRAAIIPDGSNGAFYFWHESKLKAQRVNSLGASYWAMNGKIIDSINNTTSTFNPNPIPIAIPDNKGGAIIAWQADDKNIYAQKIDSTGNPAWTYGGIPICKKYLDKHSITITNDGLGGAIISWIEKHTGFDILAAQKINSAGIIQWISNGITVSSLYRTNPSLSYRSSIVSDNSNGAIITSRNYRNAQVNIFSTKLCSGGSIGGKISGASPGVINTITTPTNVCFGDTFTISIPPVLGANSYNWSLPYGWIGHSTTNTISVKASERGTISVCASGNSCNISNVYSKYINVRFSFFTQPNQIVGNSTICPRSINNYSLSDSQATSYLWKLPNGWNGNSTSNSITATSNNNYGQNIITLHRSNTCGAKDSLKKYVTIEAPTYDYIYKGICHTDSVIFKNTVIKKSGGYSDTIPNIRGCDSIIYLILSVDTPIASIVQIGKICQGVPCTLTTNNPNLYSNFLWSTGATSSSIATTSTAPITLQYTRLGNNCPSFKSAAYTPQAIANCGGRLVVEADTLVFPTDTIKVKIKMEGGDNVFSIFSKLKCYKNSNVKYTLARSEVGNYLGTSIINQPPIITNMGSYDLLDFGMSKTAGQSGTNGSGLVYTFYFITQFINTVSLDTFNQKYQAIQFELSNPIVNDALGTQRNIDILPLVETKIIQAVQVWPGDLNADKKVNVADILPIGYFYNRTGPLRPNATLQWKAQLCGLWGDSFYVKKSRGFSVFADGNGNGKVDLADQNSIGFNLGSVHLKTEADDPIPAVKPNIGIPLNIDIAETKIIKSSLPKTIKIPVYLTSIVSNPIANLYGIALDVYFQSAYVDIANIKILYDNSVFGTLNVDCIKIEENKSTTGRIGIGLTRYNTTELNSANQEKLFDIEVPFVKGAPNGWFKVTAVPLGANDKDGDEIAIRWGVDSIFIEGDGGTGFNESKIQDFQVHAFPNPAKEILHIQFESSTISKGSILLKSLEGRLVKSIVYETPESNSNKNASMIETSIDLENISRGAYILQVIQENGKCARKVIVIE